MSEQFLTLMADLDEASQARLSGWYGRLRQQGFTGSQTPDIPYHISLAYYPLEKEAEAAEFVRSTARRLAQVPVCVSHMGVFPGGRVLFAAPDLSAELLSLRNAFVTEYSGPEPFWTPHVSLLIDEPEVIGRALPVLSGPFEGFRGVVTRLHLCAFWPTREVLAVNLPEP